MPPYSIAVCRSRSAARSITRYGYSRAEAVGRKIDELLGTAVPGSSNGKDALIWCEQGGPAIGTVKYVGGGSV